MPQKNGERGKYVGRFDTLREAEKALDAALAAEKAGST